MIFTTTIRTDEQNFINIDGVDVYTHKKTGNINEFTGSGATGRALITQEINSGDLYTVNGNNVTAYIGNIPAQNVNIGNQWLNKWVLFIFEDNVINFKEDNGSSIAYHIGNGLKLDTSTNTLSVNTVGSVEQDNTLPITSAAVYTTVGNIDVILKTI